MRAMFGLVGLLVTVGVVVWLFSLTSIPTAKEGEKAHEQAQQISGRGQDGGAAVDSFKVRSEMRGNRLESLLVTDLTAGGAVDQFYGLKKGDRIVQISTHGVLTKIGDVSNDDEKTAKAMVHDAYQASEPIVIERNGQQITLPTQAGSTPQSSPRNNPQDPLNNVLKSIPR